jgi:hypothetical protein
MTSECPRIGCVSRPVYCRFGLSPVRCREDDGQIAGKNPLISTISTRHPMQEELCKSGNGCDGTTGRHHRIGCVPHPVRPQAFLKEAVLTRRETHRIQHSRRKTHRIQHSRRETHRIQHSRRKTHRIQLSTCFSQRLHWKRPNLLPYFEQSVSPFSLVLIDFA